MAQQARDGPELPSANRVRVGIGSCCTQQHALHRSVQNVPARFISSSGGNQQHLCLNSCKKATWTVEALGEEGDCHNLCRS